MREIDTSKKEWQKEMYKLMSEKERFVILTEDKELVKILTENNYNIRDLKRVMLGTAAGAAIFGTAKAAFFARTISMVDPEPTTKTFLIAMVPVLFFVSKVDCLVNHKYKFSIRTKYGKFVFEIECCPV